MNNNDNKLNGRVHLKRDELIRTKGNIYYGQSVWGHSVGGRIKAGIYVWYRDYCHGDDLCRERIRSGCCKNTLDLRQSWGYRRNMELGDILSMEELLENLVTTVRHPVPTFPQTFILVLIICPINVCFLPPAGNLMYIASILYQLPPKVQL
jgi:hypothetical protein